MTTEEKKAYNKAYRLDKNNAEKFKGYFERAKEKREKNKEEYTIKNKERYIKNKEKSNATSKLYYKEHKDEIRLRKKECRQKDLAAAKLKDKQRKEKYLSLEKNLEKQRNYNKVRYIVNLEKRKKYLEINKEKISARNKEYNQKRKVLVTEQRKKRRQTDVHFKLKCLIQNRIWYALHKNVKSKRTVELLGCTIAELKTYLEAKFTKGMTWENNSLKGWHIDHILPCVSFDLSDPEQQKKCFYYTNLQPLWWYDNLTKRDSLDWQAMRQIKPNSEREERAASK